MALEHMEKNDLQNQLMWSIEQSHKTIKNRFEDMKQSIHK